MTEDLSKNENVNKTITKSDKFIMHTPKRSQKKLNPNSKYYKRLDDAYNAVLIGYVQGSLQ